MEKKSGFVGFWVKTIAPSIALLALVAAALHVTGVVASAEEENPIDNFHEIAPANRCGAGEGAGPRQAETLFRGSQPQEQGLQYLAAHGVKTILNLQAGSEELDQVKQLDLPLHEIHIPMTNGMGVNQLPNGKPDHDSIIAAVAEMRRPENFPEYVHCHYGDDRTGLVVALHRVFNECWNPDDADREWIRIEGWLHFLFNIPKHTYFHRVVTDPNLRDYYKKRLAEWGEIPPMNVPGIPTPEASPSSTRPSLQTSGQPQAIPVPMQEPGGVVGH